MICLMNLLLQSLISFLLTFDDEDEMIWSPSSVSGSFCDGSCFVLLPFLLPPEASSRVFSSSIKALDYEELFRIFG